MVQELEKKLDLTSDKWSFAGKTARSAGWVLAARATDRILAFSRRIVLARIMSPEDFGVFGIALLTITVLDAFTQSGLQHALIQRKGEVKEYLDSVWSTQVVRSAIIAAGMLIGAPLIASFFKEPSSVSILRISGISILFLGAVNIGTLFFQKELQFRKLFIYNASGTLANTIVAVLAGEYLRNAWALVFGLLAGNLCLTALSYRLHSYRPRFRIDLKKIKELYGFGRWISVSNWIMFFQNNGDSLFVGRFLGAASLGIYQMSYTISNIMAAEISNSISQVTFPAYSKIQDNLHRLKLGYFQTLKVTSIVSIFVTAFVYLIIGDITKVLLGPSWNEIIPITKVLVLWGLCRSLSATTGALFSAVGRPDITTKIQLAKLIILALLIYPLGIKYGAVGTAIAVVCSAIPVDPVAVWVAIRHVGGSFKELINTFLPPAFSAGTVIMCWMSFQFWFPIENGWLRIMTLSILSLVSYIGMMGLLNRFFTLGIQVLLREIISGFRMRSYNYTDNE